MNNLLTCRVAESDAHLLSKFIKLNDTRAFSQIVHRHGSMIFSVCKRILRDTHDAEDVSQAVFLVLARRAKSIRNPSSLSAWLHGVASRLSHKLRCKYAKEQKHSHQLKGPTTADAESFSQADFTAMVDEELTRLPDKLRLPLILCYLQGRTHDEAAHQLGWKTTELRGRLERGRMKLKKRIEARGIAFSTAMFGMAMTQVHAMPAVLTIKSLNAANFSQSQTIPGLTPSVASLFKTGLGIVPNPLIGVPGIALLLLLTGALMTLAYGFASTSVPTKESPVVVAVGQRPGDQLPEHAIARLGSLRFRHSFYVQKFQLLPAVNLIASISQRTLYFWNMTTGMPVSRLEYNYRLDELAASADGKYVAFGDGNHSLHVVDTVSGKEIWETSLKEYAPPKEDKYDHDSSGIHQIYLQNKGIIRVYGPDQQIRVWDYARKELVRTIDVTDLEITTLDWSIDGETCCLVSKMNPDCIQMRKWNLWKEQRTVNTSGKIKQAILSPNAQHAVVISQDKPTVAEVWDLTSGEKKHTLDVKLIGYFRAIFSQDGSLLATGGDGPIRFWDVLTGKLLQTTETKPILIYHSAFSADSKTFYFTHQNNFLHECDVASGQLKNLDSLPKSNSGRIAFTKDFLVTSSNNHVYLWDLKTRKLFRTITGTSYVSDLAIASKHEWLVIGRRDGTLQIEELRTEKSINNSKPVSELELLAVSPDEQTMVIWPGPFNKEDEMRKLRIFDLSTMKLTGSLEIPPARDDQPQVRPSLHNLCFAPDGRMILASSGTHRHILRWDFQKRTTLPVSHFHQGSVHSLAIDSSQRILATLGYDYCVYLWDMAKGTLRNKFEVGHHTRIAITPDGQVVAVGNHGLTTLLDRNESTRQMDNLTEISLISVETGNVITKLKGHVGGVLNLAFSADGKELYSVGLDSTIVIWDVSRLIPVRKLP